MSSSAPVSCEEQRCHWSYSFAPDESYSIYDTKQRHGSTGLKQPGYTIRRRIDCAQSNRGVLLEEKSTMSCSSSPGLGPDCTPTLCSHVQCIIHLFSISDRIHQKQMSKNTRRLTERQISRMVISVLTNYHPFPSFLVVLAKTSLDGGWSWTWDFLLKNFDRYSCLAAIFALVAKLKICTWENIFPEPTDSLVTGGARKDIVSNFPQLCLYHFPF